MLDSLQEQIRAELRARRSAPSDPKADGMASIWDRRPATVDEWGFAKRPLPQEKKRDKTQEEARVVPPLPAKEDDLGPSFARKSQDSATPAVRDSSGDALGWGFAKKAEAVVESTKPAAKSTLRARPSSKTIVCWPPPVPEGELFPEPTPSKKAQAKAKGKQEPKPKPKPKPKQERKSKRELKPSPLLRALANHSRINPGQQATVEMIYQRFAPGATKADKGPSNLLEALALDPNLNKGQADTLRTVVERFDKKG
ncbi:MAG: hypothetical protein JRH20_18695 [Deltaproteobacteria bacterium]|nr:hypothetical protein [Deltaproteobacteria bacterium]